MDALARKTPTKKPAVRKRKPVAKAAKTSRAGQMGWVIALAIGTGWVAADGRALSYVGSIISPDSIMTAGIAPRPAPERLRNTATGSDEDVVVAAKPRMRPAEPVSKSANSTPAKPAETLSVRSASITPSPAPRLLPMAMPRRTDNTAKLATPDRVAAAIKANDTADAGLPRKLLPSFSPAPERRTSAPPSAAASSAERHATRRLDVRSDPEDAARVIAQIDTGSMVRVVRSEGRWRYVESRASAARGWVDGTFLAGESAPAPQALASRLFGNGATPDSRLDAPSARPASPVISAPIPPASLPTPIR